MAQGAPGGKDEKARSFYAGLEASDEKMRTVSAQKDEANKVAAVLAVQMKTPVACHTTNQIGFYTGDVVCNEDKKR